MTKAVRELLQNGHNGYDEPDRMPKNISISNLDLIMYAVAIIGHFVDLAVDLNVAVRYYLAKEVEAFGWTLAFILFPAFVNTAVSIRMYAQDKQQDSVTNEVTKRHWLRIFILVLQMAPILRFTDALILYMANKQMRQTKPAWDIEVSIKSLVHHNSQRRVVALLTLQFATVIGGLSFQICGSNGVTYEPSQFQDALKSMPELKLMHYGRCGRLEQRRKQFRSQNRCPGCIHVEPSTKNRIHQIYNRLINMDLGHIERGNTALIVGYTPGESEPEAPNHLIQF